MKVIRESTHISGFRSDIPVKEVPALTPCGEALCARGHALKPHIHAGFEFHYLSGGGNFTWLIDRELVTHLDRRIPLNELAAAATMRRAALIRATYHSLGLRTYFTAGEKAGRAWTIHQGDTAPRAAGVIHSDFERCFIKAETVAHDDLIKCGSVAFARGKGLYRMEGKEYVVKDGDALLFKFNV